MPRKPDEDHADDYTEGGKKIKVRKSDDHPDDHADGDKKENVRSGKSDDHAGGHKKKKQKHGSKGVVVDKDSEDIFNALKLVVKKAQSNKGLSRGVNECLKIIQKGGAKLCLLAENFDDQDYIKLIKALCTEQNVGFLLVSTSTTLGEWAGLCRFDAEGNATKVVSCSCLVVKDFGEDTDAVHIVQEFLGQNKVEEGSE